MPGWVEEWGLWILIGGFLLLTNTLDVALTAYASVRRMARDTLVPLSPGDPDWLKLERGAHASTQWAVQRGFVRVGYYKVRSGPLVALWQRPGDATVMGLYVVQSLRFHDFVTVFEDRIGLTTGSSSNGHFFPKWPGSYVQSFAISSIDDQLARHEQAATFLTGHGARRSTEAYDVVAHFDQSIQKQLAWVRSHFLWPLRAIFWFWVRRFLWHGVPVAEQVRRGWVPPPEALPPRRETPAAA